MENALTLDKSTKIQGRAAQAKLILKALAKKLRSLELGLMVSDMGFV